MKSKTNKKTRRPGKPPVASKSRNYFLAGAVVVAGVALLVVLNVWRKPPSPTSGEPATPLAPANESTNAPAPAPSPADFQKLRGKWLRPDGGYVIEIKSVAADGRLEAGYFNPRSIHVAQAQARSEDGRIKVFIELQDVNYPGSTYTLTYLPQRELLVGVYYQAVQKQSYDVYFERTP